MKISGKSNVKPLEPTKFDEFLKDTTRLNKLEDLLYHVKDFDCMSIAKMCQGTKNRYTVYFKHYDEYVEVEFDTKKFTYFIFTVKDGRYNVLESDIWNFERQDIKQFINHTDLTVIPIKTYLLRAFEEHQRQ